MVRRGSSALTEYECHILALVARDQPATAYRVRRTIESSPSAGISSSAGAVYPIVKRLKEKGLVTTAPVESDGRNTELLLITREGRAALRQWVKTITPEQLLPEDTLRTRMSHAHLLPPAERIGWLEKVRDALQAKLEEIEGYARQWPEGMITYAHRNARLITQTRIAWIEDVLADERVQLKKAS